MALLLIVLVILLPLFLVVKWFLDQQRRASASSSAKRRIVFFHPYSHGMGGGERVLYQWIKSFPSNKAVSPDHPEYVELIICTGDVESLVKAEDSAPLLTPIEERFKLELSSQYRITFVPLKSRTLLEAKWYPVLTLFGQAVGSMVVGLEASLRLLFQLNVFGTEKLLIIDSLGLPFSYPVFRLFLFSALDKRVKASLYAYIHYPVISSDMLERVASSSTASFNNRSIFVKNAALRELKLMYYRLFAKLYGWVGRSCVDQAFTNSSWTNGHIIQLWGMPSRTKIIYPPCDVEELSQLVNIASDPRQSGSIQIISVGQFRPEKNHRLQLEILHDLLLEKGTAFKLLLVGGARNEEDRKRIEQLQRYAKDELKLPSESYEFHVNVTFEELKRLLSTSHIGIHTMRDEHFGISVVEYMASGLVTVAYGSAGPLLDIVVPYQNEPVGYVACERKEYVSIISKIQQDYLPPDKSKIRELVARARSSVGARFSARSFEASMRKHYDDWISR